MGNLTGGIFFPLLTRIPLFPGSIIGRFSDKKKRHFPLFRVKMKKKSAKSARNRQILGNNLWKPIECELVDRFKLCAAYFHFCVHILYRNVFVNNFFFVRNDLVNKGLAALVFLFQLIDVGFVFMLFD